MKRIPILIFIILMTALNHASSQDKDLENALEQIKNQLEILASNTDQELDFNTLLEDLISYYNNPLNLNTATREDLQNLYVLSDIQISALLSHIEQNGKLLAIEELQTIEGYDLQTIKAIFPFVKIHHTDSYSALTIPVILNVGKSMLLLRTSKILENAKGYDEKNPENNDTTRYLGSPLKIYSRYRFTLNNRLSFGITGEKDSGEEFFNGSQKNGFDFYSAHLFFQGNGVIKKIALGDFQLQYGQGLVLWSGLSYGKSTDVMNVKKNDRGILPYISSDENIFMRGAAISVGTKNITTDFFFSSKKIDANLVASDTLSGEEDVITSFQEGGYHRTYAELKDKHSLRTTIFGGKCKYQTNHIQLGVTAYTTSFDKTIEQSKELYKQFEFSGDQNLNLGFDYSYSYRNFSFFGETGMSDNHALATINGLLISLDHRVTLSIVQRFYERDYQALLSNALAENSKVSNEQGTYIGLNLKLTRSLIINSYFDQFKFPWLRYQVNSPSAGYEYITQLNYIPSKHFEVYGRIKHTNKSNNNSISENPIIPVEEFEQTNYRLNIWYRISQQLSLSNRVELLSFNEKNNRESGYLIYQDIRYKPSNSFTLTFRYALFDSDSYDSRIYAYEHDVLYAYSIPSYYYKGNRYYFLFKYSLTRKIDFELRYASTVYNNKKSIGSGLDEIEGNKKSELKAQVRISF